jgi:hypothetical protein
MYHTSSQFRSERIAKSVSQRLRLIEWLKFLSPPENKGVGTTILRMLNSPKSSSIKRDIKRLLDLESCKIRVSVIRLDSRFPNPNCTTPINPFSRPGDRLGFYLSQFEVTIDEDCDCNNWLDHMNIMGSEWCSNRISTITNWLSREAQSRGFVFNQATAEKLIRKCINIS